MENEPTTHECRICGRVFDAMDTPEICNKCLHDAHKHRPRLEPDRPVEVEWIEAPEEFRKPWDEYEREYDK